MLLLVFVIFYLLHKLIKNSLFCSYKLLIEVSTCIILLTEQLLFIAEPLRELHIDESDLKLHRQTDDANKKSSPASPSGSADNSDQTKSRLSPLLLSCHPASNYETVSVDNYEEPSTGRLKLNEPSKDVDSNVCSSGGSDTACASLRVSPRTDHHRPRPASLATISGASTASATDKSRSASTSSEELLDRTGEDSATEPVSSATVSP